MKHRIAADRQLLPDNLGKLGGADKTQSLRCTINKLQDTPLLAVGVNFGFVEESPRRDLIKRFDFTDNPLFGGAGWELQERRIVRKMKREQDTVNLTLTFDGQEVTIEFNYHTDTTNNEAAREAIQGKVLRLREASLQLLSKVYLLEEEKDNG